jgi:hypothetical protein
METRKVFYGTPEVVEAQRIAEVRKMNYQQRFEKFIAIYELSYMLKNAKKYSLKDKLNEQANS